MKLENIQILILRILGYKIEDINVKENIESSANLAKKAHLLSVDITELFFDKFNFKRFLLGILDLIFLLIYFTLLLAFSSIDSLFKLVDNEFMPENLNAIIIAFVFIYFGTISVRIDILTAEINGKLKFLKIAYFFQENIKEKHGLTDSNFKKLLIWGKLTEVLILRTIGPFIVLFINLIYLLMAIRSLNITLILSFPLFLHAILLIYLTIAFIGLSGVVIIYYTKLIFDQINDEIEMICKRSKWFVSFPNQRRLIWLAHKHNYYALLVNNANLVIRRSAALFFIVFPISTLIIPLNLSLYNHDYILQIFYIIYTFLLFSGGLLLAYLLSIVIESAHKPYKLIYKILRKRSFNLDFKLKVLIWY